MAMALQMRNAAMAEINVTPLVDVMLVLLIIFMISAPLMSHKIRIDLPEAALDQAPPSGAAIVTVAVRETGEIYWNDALLSPAQFEQNLAVTAQIRPQPQLDIRADKRTRYGVIDDVVQRVRVAGIREVGFVSTREH